MASPPCSRFKTAGWACQAEADHVGEAALDALHQGAATALQRKATGALQGLAGGHVGLNLDGTEGRELHPGGDGAETHSWLLAARPQQQTVPGVQRPPAAGHALPARDRLRRISGLAEHLRLERQHRITAQHCRDHRVGATGLHRRSLGLGQQLHQLDRIRMVDGILIDTAHLHPVRDARLVQQAPAGRGGGSEQEHNSGEELPLRMAAVIQVA